MSLPSSFPKWIIQLHLAPYIALQTDNFCTECSFFFAYLYIFFDVCTFLYSFASFYIEKYFHVYQVLLLVLLNEIYCCNLDFAAEEGRKRKGSCQDWSILIYEATLIPIVGRPVLFTSIMV